MLLVRGWGCCQGGTRRSIRLASPDRSGDRIGGCQGAAAHRSGPGKGNKVTRPGSPAPDRRCLVPAWPHLTLTLRRSGAREAVEIAGALAVAVTVGPDGQLPPDAQRTGPADRPDVRRVAIELVAQTARHLGRPVRATALEPAGRYELIILPSGTAIARCARPPCRHCT